MIGTGAARPRTGRRVSCGRARLGVGGWLLVLAAMVTLVGCGPGGWEGQARAAATSFHEDLARGDGEAACALLTESARSALESASGQPCSQALPDLGLHGGIPASVEVWETQARVAFDADVVFLARFPSGWQVSAAGCEPASDTYDCTVEG